MRSTLHESFGKKASVTEQKVLLKVNKLKLINKQHTICFENANVYKAPLLMAGL